MNIKRITASAAVVMTAAISIQGDNDNLETRAQQLHDNIISVDTHTDSALYLPLDESQRKKVLQITFEKMRTGRLDCVFLPIFVRQNPLDDTSRDNAFSYADQKMNAIVDYINARPSEAMIALTPDDVKKAKKDGKLSFVMGLENGFPIGRDLSKLEYFYNKGARIITLSHNCHNDICDASNDSVTVYHGLSEFGYELVSEMNRLGMIIDVSHTSTETLYDCLEASKAPIIASHSCVHAIKQIPRNLTDAEIRAIAEKGGVVQVTTGRWALSNKPKPEVNISCFCDHADYIKNLVGIEYVGIGTDFDGGGGMNQLEDSSKMKDITIELMRRGWTDSDLELFWGGNVLRVWKEICKVSAQMK